MEFISANMVCGEPFEVEFLITEEQIALPLDSFNAKVQLRAESESGAAIKVWQDTDTELTRDDGNGIITLIIPPSTTQIFKFKKAYFDLLLFEDSDTDGIRSNVIEVTLQRGVTAR